MGGKRRREQVGKEAGPQEEVEEEEEEGLYGGSTDEEMETDVGGLPYFTLVVFLLSAVRSHNNLHPHLLIMRCATDWEGRGW